MPGDDEANYVEFETGAGTLALHAVPSHIADGIDVSSPPGARESEPIKLRFEVEDVAWERKRLEALGVAILTRPWGGCDAVDPEGNIFSISGRR